MRMLKVIVRNKYIDPFSNLDGKCERKNNLFRLTGDGKRTEWKESNSVCNHTSDLQNRESDLLINDEYDNRQNWVTRRPVTNYYNCYNFRTLEIRQN